MSVTRFAEFLPLIYPPELEMVIYIIFLQKNEYVKKLWEHVYDCIHHGPV
jgi:hypothetical protein